MLLRVSCHPDGVGVGRAHHAPVSLARNNRVREVTSRVSGPCALLRRPPPSLILFAVNPAIYEGMPLLPGIHRVRIALLLVVINVCARRPKSHWYHA